MQWNRGLYTDRAGDVFVHAIREIGLLNKLRRLTEGKYLNKIRAIITFFLFNLFCFLFFQLLINEFFYASMGMNILFDIKEF